MSAAPPDSFDPTRALPSLVFREAWVGQKSADHSAGIGKLRVRSPLLQCFHAGQREGVRQTLPLQRPISLLARSLFAFADYLEVTADWIERRINVVRRNASPNGS